MLSWLERTLLEERQALESALAAKHLALLRELSPYLQGVERNKIKGEEITDPTLPGSSPESSEGDMNGDRRHIRTEASKVTPPPCFHEVVPQPMPSSVCEASHCKDIEHHHSGGEQSKHILAPWAWRRPGSSNKPLKEILSLRSESNGGAVSNGLFARLDRFVRGAAFESGFAFLILINTLVMALESQHAGIDTGWKVGYPGSDSSASDTWPGATILFEVAEWIFGVLFTIELLMKLVCLGKRFCADTWNLIDTIIVIGWFLTVIAFFPTPIDLMF